MANDVVSEAEWCGAVVRVLGDRVIEESSDDERRLFGVALVRSGRRVAELGRQLAVLKEWGDVREKALARRIANLERTDQLNGGFIRLREDSDEAVEAACRAYENSILARDPEATVQFDLTAMRAALDAVRTSEAEGTDARLQQRCDALMHRLAVADAGEAKLLRVLQSVRDAEANCISWGHKRDADFLRRVVPDAFEGVTQASTAELKAQQRCDDLLRARDFLALVGATGDHGMNEEHAVLVFEDARRSEREDRARERNRRALEEEEKAGDGK